MREYRDRQLLRLRDRPDFAASARRIAHRSEDCVSCSRQRDRGRQTDARTGAGDQCNCHEYLLQPCHGS